MTKLLLAFAPMLLSASIIQPGDFPVSPQGTYLHQAPTDTCAAYGGPGCSSAPTVIDLGALAVSVGDLLTIEQLGQWCAYAGEDCQVYPARLEGLFSDSATVLGPEVLARVPGAVDAGAPENVTGAAWLDGTPTDVAWDFLLPVAVRVSAQWLVVGVADSSWSDNTGTLAVRLGVEAVPEPSNVSLWLAGVVAVLIVAKRRKA
jgi:hypothetical protein